MLWSLYSYTVVGFGEEAPPGCVRVEVPVIFWSRKNAPTSAENVRFLTGVQRVITPTWATLKSGLHEKPPAAAAAFGVKGVPAALSLLATM